MHSIARQKNHLTYCPRETILIRLYTCSTWRQITAVVNGMRPSESVVNNYRLLRLQHVVICQSQTRGGPASFPIELFLFFRILQYFSQYLTCMCSLSLY